MKLKIISIILIGVFLCLGRAYADEYWFHSEAVVEGSGSLHGIDYYSQTQGDGDYARGNTTMANGSVTGLKYIQKIDAHKGEIISYTKNFDATTSPETMGLPHAIEVNKSYAYVAESASQDGVVYPAPNATFRETSTVGLTSISTKHDVDQPDYPISYVDVAAGSRVSTASNVLESLGGTNLPPAVSNTNAGSIADNNFVQNEINASGKGSFGAYMNGYIVTGMHVHPTGDVIQGGINTHKVLEASGVYQNFHKINGFSVGGGGQ